MFAPDVSLRKPRHKKAFPYLERGAGRRRFQTRYIIAISVIRLLLSSQLNRARVEGSHQACNSILDKECSATDPSKREGINFSLLSKTPQRRHL